MGLNDVHLELKVDGAAASQRNSMANARDRWVKEVRLFPLCFDTGSGWKRKHGWLYGKEHKETGEPPGRREVKEQSIEEPTTHIQYGTHTHTHTFVQVVRPIGRYEEGCAGHR